MSSFKKNFLVDAGGYIDMKNKFSLRFFGVVVPFSTYIFLKQDGVPNFLFRPPVYELIINLQKKSTYKMDKKL